MQSTAEASHLQHRQVTGTPGTPGTLSMLGRMRVSRVRLMSALKGLTAALALLIALSSCRSSTSSPSPRLLLSDCVVAGNVHARCGALMVAENPSAPEGRKISLNVVVLPARTSPRAADPLFYLEGGPGARPPMKSRGSSSISPP
jgi:hypothetical protein